MTTSIPTPYTKTTRSYVSSSRRNTFSQKKNLKKMSSIFIKDLHPNVTESTLYQKFSSIGPVLSLRVCREAETNRSLGYAFVNFIDPIHANRAIETLNFELFEGMPIQVVQAEKNPLLRKTIEPNVFIKNLDKSVTNRELYVAFSEFGNVSSVKVAKDRNGISKGYGFVQLDDDDSAMRSILQLNGLLVKSKILLVQRFVKQKMKELNDKSEESFTNIYVKNIGKDVTSQELKEMFEKFGKVVSPKIMTEPDGTSRGFGFVSFENPNAARNAVLELNGRILSNGKALYVGRAQTKNARELMMKTNQFEYAFEKGNLCVSNLDDAVDDDRLRKDFQAYGTVIGAKVMMKQGRSIGIGYVCFSRQEDAIKAIAAMNGRIIGTKPVIVYLTEGMKFSFGERRLLDARVSLRPDMLEIPNTTLLVNGVEKFTTSSPSENVRKPDMTTVLRMLSPTDTVESFKFHFDRI